MRLRHLAASLLTVSALAVGSNASASPSKGMPAWPRVEIARTLKLGYGNAKPVRIDTIDYPRKIAVVLTFDHIVICGYCSAPSNDVRPRGRILRISFDRQTHSIGNSLRFCETRIACLYR